MYIDPDIDLTIIQERKGEIRDFEEILADSWIQDSEVKYLVKKYKGRWHVKMLFISLENLIKIRIREIDHYHSKTKAIRFAEIFQRAIRKDARGTLKRKHYAYSICKN